MIHIMMDIDEHQDQKYTWGDNNGRDLYLLGVNVLVKLGTAKQKDFQTTAIRLLIPLDLAKQFNWCDIYAKVFLKDENDI